MNMQCAKVCDTCNYYSIDEAFASGCSSGKCRHSPPVGPNSWPKVFSRDWCGGWVASSWSDRPKESYFVAREAPQSREADTVAQVAPENCVKRKPGRPKKEQSANDQAKGSSGAESKVVRSGWSCKDWQQATGISHSSVYELLKAGEINSVKFRGKRLITTQPQDFLDSLSE